MPSSNDEQLSDRAEVSWVDSAVAEANGVVSRYDCHEARNDLMALVLHQSSCRKGGEYDAALVEGCLKRLRVLAESGQYPKEMLYEREKDLRESASN